MRGPERHLLVHCGNSISHRQFHDAQPTLLRLLCPQLYFVVRRYVCHVLTLVDLIFDLVILITTVGAIVPLLHFVVLLAPRYRRISCTPGTPCPSAETLFRIWCPQFISFFVLTTTGVFPNSVLSSLARRHCRSCNKISRTSMLVSWTGSLFLTPG
ncbi:hypothetical protein C8F04DRAFT_282658 [Mycena alexandri]|uniref:Uncharacterized protein n=1 Tax=Mycena alexandri TaxID=1745969 RepID=A0AAD6T5V5_9AGAR|nr:hypothetical protein C8F04DRAFT_282658 [Mycena alexandri]